MKTQPIQPARVEFASDPATPPRAPDFDDLYHPRIGALAQARHVFLQGNGLPGRWAGRTRFVVLETGFGLGNNFLATWQAWREDPARCQHLVFVSIERHPLTRADLARAHEQTPLPELAAELVQAWPSLTPNVHALDFEAGRVQLLLALGDVALMLPALRLQADAFFLDGFAPARNPAMWQPRVLKALARKAAAGATLATWSVARELRSGLGSAGFEVQTAAGIGGKREITVAHWAPHFAPRNPPAAASQPPHTALVIGAGVAGAAAAQALLTAGLSVTVLDRHAAPAAEASGNPAALVHGTVNADDGPYARLFRAAALEAQRCYRAAASQQPGLADMGGLLRLQLQDAAQPAMAATLQRLGLPADYVQALDTTAASSRAGVALPAAAWHYPGGGWVDPARWVRQVLALPGLAFQGGALVGSIRRHGGHWVALDAQGAELARAEVLVLACTASMPRLLETWLTQPWPLSATQGQVTQIDAAATGLLRPVAGDGYAIPLSDGSLLCGATRGTGTLSAMDAPPALTAADQALNLERLQRLIGSKPDAGAAPLRGRAAWRLHADDRMPIAGALPLPDLPAGQRRDQARLLPRIEGLFVLTALGARGLTLAPLLGRLIAAQATGAPWPLEQDLADAIDPARWLVRAARRATRHDQLGDQPVV